jgi:ribosomal protein L40E
MNFRIIGKFCLLLVIIGFFMPMACDQNAFQLIDNGMLKTEGVVAIYVAFILAIVGLIIGIALLMKKEVPILIDWLIALSVSGVVIIMFFYIGYGQGYHKYFQSGTYMALIGSIVILLSQIISAITNVNNKVNYVPMRTVNKKCRKCHSIYTESNSVCPKCGSSLYVETSEEQSDSWVCKECGERNPNTALSCKGCGAYK